MSNNTALTISHDIAFISEHLESHTAITPKTEEGQLVYQLLAQREESAILIQNMNEAMQQALEFNQQALSYFGLARVPGNPGTVDHAIKSLDCEKWQAFFDKAETVRMLPTRMSSDFKAKIKARDIPPFTEEIVLSTLKSWMQSQYRFIAERIDGVFHALSPEHVTNSPAGFSKKMIISHVAGMKSESKKGRYIDDLRVVIASFQNNENLLKGGNLESSKLFDHLHAKGCFDTDIELDGGAIVCRLFKVGTVHLYIHPDIAFKLNDILAMLYPQAIPAKFRKKSPVRERFFKETIQQTLPPQLITELYEALRTRISRAYVREQFGYRDDIDASLKDSDRYVIHVSEMVENHAMWPELRTLLQLRRLNCRTGNGKNELYAIEYDTKDVAHALLQNGCFPDKKSHQFFATKGQLAADAAAWLLEDDAEGLTYLEPQAGQGDLLRLLPINRKIVGVELSDFNVAIAKAFVPRAKIHHANFLDFAAQSVKYGKTFDRILSNPPYSNGQALHHTQVAAQLLPVGGVMVAVLPTSLKGVSYDGFLAKESEDYHNAFNDAGVSVFLLKLTRSA